MDTPETTRTVNEIIHAGLIEAFSQCENIEPPKMENIKHTQRNKLNSTVGKENNPVLKRVKSCKISCSHPKYKMWNEVGIVERTKAWKAERDKKIESKRKEKSSNETQKLTFTPHLAKAKDYSNVSVIEALCPVIYASKIEKRTKMSVKRHNRKR